MQEIMFNHVKLMTPEIIGKLPFVLAAFSFETIVVNATLDRRAILNLLKMLANTFNSPLLMLSEEQTLAVKRELY